MKFLVVFITAVVMSVNSAPHHPIVYSAVYQPVPAVTQWHSQSGLGDYAYGYQGGPSAKSEIKTLDGITQGSYSYIDAESKLQTVNYVSDANGFRVAATNLPVDSGKAPQAVEDTPEVKAAKLEHAAALKKAENSEAPAEEVAPLKAPEPVEDTVEVKAAREEHLKAHELAKNRAAVADHTEIIAPATYAVHSPLIVPQAYHLAPHATVVRTVSPFAYSVYNAGIPHLIHA